MEKETMTPEKADDLSWIFEPPSAEAGVLSTPATTHPDKMPVGRMPTLAKRVATERAATIRRLRGRVAGAHYSSGGRRGPTVGSRPNLARVLPRLHLDAIAWALLRQRLRRRDKLRGAVALD